MILPAMGVASEVVAAFTRKKIFGYSFVAFSSLAIAFLGFLVWAHHMFVAGISRLLGDDLLLPQLLRRRPVGDQSLQLDGDAVSSVGRAADADALHPRLHRPLHHRRRHGTLPRRDRPRRPRHRHLLRRRALPLRHGRRHGHGLHGRASTTGGRRSPAGCIRNGGRAWRRCWSSSAST